MTPLPFYVAFGHSTRRSYVPEEFGSGTGTSETELGVGLRKATTGSAALEESKGNGQDSVVAGSEGAGPCRREQNERDGMDEIRAQQKEKR